MHVHMGAVFCQSFASFRPDLGLAARALGLDICFITSQTVFKKKQLLGNLMIKDSGLSSMLFWRLMKNGHPDRHQVLDY